MSHIPQSTNLLIVKPKVFRSYIGVKSYPKRLHEFPADIIKVDDFHFILGFATENNIGTGYFTTNWNTSYFGPEKVVSLKKTNPNAKVIISIGGRGKDHEFNPQEQKLWIETAFSTIKVILEDYKVEDPCHCEPHYTIDGIDVNYEFVNPQVDVEVFSNCIGTLIEKLKVGKINVNIVSIAPSASSNDHYKKLYSDYSEHIKYVCYQFYNQDMSPSPPPNKPTKKFEDLYDILVADYSAGIVLAGGTTDPDNVKNLTPENFIEGCEALINHGKLPGIFIWNANDSDTLQSNKRFIIEGLAQDLLIASSSK